MLALRVCEHVVEQARDRLGGRRVAEREVLERRHVVAARKELADRRLAVASGAADLLRVRLESLRQVEVVDVAHVCLVDPHPERDRRDDHVRVRVCPPLLHLDTIIGAHARVVGTRGQACRRQQGSDTLRRALQRDVDDRRAGRALAQAVDQRLVALTCVDRRGEQR